MKLNEVIDRNQFKGTLELFRKRDGNGFSATIKTTSGKEFNYLNAPQSFVDMIKDPAKPKVNIQFFATDDGKHFQLVKLLESVEEDRTMVDKRIKKKVWMEKVKTLLGDKKFNKVASGPSSRYDFDHAFENGQTPEDVLDDLS